MKNFILFSLLFSISFYLYPQSASSIQDDYDQIFEINKDQYGDREYLKKTVNTLEEDHQLSGLVNKNKLYLDYLLTNFSNQDNYQQLLALEDSCKLQEKYITSLKKDSLFNSALIRFSEKKLNPAFVPDTVSIDEVLNVAVKFFYVKEITEEGNYKGKVCGGINGISTTLPERKPHLEAFSFAAVLQNLQEQEKDIYGEFITAVRELYKMDLGVDRDERLFRAQGAMFFLMRNNPRLKDLLLTEYEKKKEYLPFVIEN